jgi:hypothetical protein
MTEVKKFGKSATSLSSTIEGLNTGSQGDNNATFFRLTDGDHKFRILPPLDGKDVCFKADIHFGIMIDGKESAVLCDRVKSGRCPICEDSEAHFKLGTKDSKYKGWQLSPRPYFLYNAIDVTTGDIGVLSADLKCQKEIVLLQESCQKLDEPFDIWDASKGES